MTNSELASALPPGKTAGVCLHITSLPGPYGIGEIGEAARRFVDAMREMKLTVWQFLPTGPTAFGESPYQPLSTFAGNELLIDVRDLIEKGLLENDEAQELAALSKEYVDYDALIPIKTRLLRLAASRFEEQAAFDLKTACDRFVEENDELWLHDYALYRILRTQHGERPWPEWAPEYMRRDAEAMTALEASADTQIADIKVIQFLFFEQWGRMRDYANKRGIRLFGGMPIRIALDSADAWAHPEILRIDDDGRPEAVTGVPLDYIAEDGQLWGNARLAIAPMQDFLGLGSEARIDTPGTSGEDWRWRLIETQLSDEVRGNIASMVSTSGRAPA